jgi:L-glyceraldehyde 3-phosphate reductase
VLRLPAITTALIGASKVRQLEENLAALDHVQLSADETAAIERILAA